MADPESPFYIKPRLDRELLRWLWRFRAACTGQHLARALPVLRDLSYASLALYRELANLPGLDFGYLERGALQVFRTAKGLAEVAQAVEVLAGAGIDARLVDQAEAHAIEPALAPSVVGAVLFREDAQLIPGAFVTGLAQVAEKLGVSVRRQTEVIGFRRAGERIVTVETTRGDFEADEIVLAAGSWSPGLARALGLRLPIQAGKGYSVTYRRPPDGPRLPLLLGEARMAVTPMGDTLRFGGTLELAGLDLSINRRRVDALTRSARGYLPGAERFERLETWRGLRPCTPDGLPLLGRTAGCANLLVATGHAMVGMSLGPVTGKLVAQLAAGQPPELDLSLLAPDRFR
jgi:D-amino-acid dehydrogenase